MGLHGWEFLIVASWFIVPALVLAGAVLLVYWVVRRAVAAGIRDARAMDPVPGPTTENAPRATSDPTRAVAPGRPTTSDDDAP